jgi:hypothetical protein
MFRNSIPRHLSSSCTFAAPVEAGAGGSRPTPPKTSVPRAGKSPFAHLARGTAKAADEDDKDKDAKEESEGEEDDEEDEDKKSKKKAKKADDGDEDDAGAKDGDDDEEDGDDKKKSKKSKKAEDGDDDDSDREDDDDPEARAARARERGRIRAIVTSDAGKLNPVGAMELACGTSMSRAQAIGTLRAMGVPAAAEPRKTDALRNRMAGVDTPDVGAGDAPPPVAAGSAKAIAAEIIAAGKKRRGEI